MWSDILYPVLNQYIPWKRVRPNRQNKPWYNPYLYRLARVSDRLFRRSRGQPVNSRIMVAYRAVRNLYVHELRAAERCFYRSLVGQLSYESLTSRPQYWWKRLRLKSISSWKSACPVPPLSDGSWVVLDSEAKAELLNDSFVKQCSNPPAQQVPCLPRVDSGVGFVIEDIMESDVLSALRD